MQAVFVQGRHGVGAVGEHGALVDRALVGDLALVDGGRLRQQAQARDAVGAAGGWVGTRAGCEVGRKAGVERFAVGVGRGDCGA